MKGMHVRHLLGIMQINVTNNDIKTVIGGIKYHRHTPHIQSHLIYLRCEAISKKSAGSSNKPIH